MSDNQQELSRDEIKLEEHLEVRRKTISLLIKAMTKGVETVEEYDLLAFECDPLPEFDPEDPQDSFEEIREKAATAFGCYGQGIQRRTPFNAPEYLAWILCTGGPVEEIRFYVNGHQEVYSASFVYKEWPRSTEKILTQSEHPWVWDAWARLPRL